jgi:putative salt-induced outer membrane protein
MAADAGPRQTSSAANAETYFDYVLPQTCACGHPRCKNSQKIPSRGLLPIARFGFMSPPWLMKVKKIPIPSVILAVAALAGVASAQTNYVTVTNFVTVTITNVVILTNAGSAPISITAPVVVAPNKKAEYAWNNSISAGLTLARGNTDITMVSGDYSTAKKTPKDEYSATLGAAFGEQDSKQTVDNYKGSIQWNHFLTTRFYDYLRGDGLRDYIADVDYRVTGGPGMGYYLLKDTNTTLSAETGVNYEAESLAGLNTSFTTVRLANKFEHKVNNHARFWQSLEVFPQVDEFGNYVVNFEIGAEANFTKSFGLKTYLDDNYYNRPAADHVKNDVKLVTGIAYKF